MAGLAGAATLVRRHASVRSVWFLNSLRGALALAAAVAVADLSGVQHAFWVVLGTLSVLRTSAAATGATAWRALAGTVVGFVVGAALLVGIGTAQDALWVAFPLAVAGRRLRAGDHAVPGRPGGVHGDHRGAVQPARPGRLAVGLLRVEDVAIGCAVSLAVGVLFWPRGVASVVGDDLADAFRSGAAYLTQAVDWALSELHGAARRGGRRRERGHPARRRGPRAASPSRAASGWARTTCGRWSTPPPGSG